VPGSPVARPQPGSIISAQRVARELTEHWHLVHQNGALNPLACSLLEAHTLSAALHIAAALLVCENRPVGFVFVTADRRQADAARCAGFSVEFL
jgi:predicted nucleic acid-binding protein